MNMHLISYSHQITIYQDTQPTLNYNLNYFCLWYSQAPGELTLPKDRYLLWGYSHRIWLQLLEQKYAQNLLRSGLSHDCLIPLDVTILPLLFMVPCVTITGGSYLEYLSCWKKKKKRSQRNLHTRDCRFQYLILKAVVSSLTWKREASGASQLPLIPAEEEGISWSLCGIRSHIIILGLNLQAAKIAQATFLDTQQSLLNPDLSTGPWAHQSS